MLLLSGALAAGVGIAAISDPGPPRAGAASDWGGAPYDDENQDQQNNSYMPGVGFYHSPFHAWYPLFFNTHDPRRGYYYGGSWHPVPFAGRVPATSKPSPAGWMRAHLARGGSGGHGGGFGGFFSSLGRGFGSISRGGFGSHGFGGHG